MPRKKTKSLKRNIGVDSLYSSELVAKFINKVMLGGKKRLAERLVYSALDQASKELKVEPLDLFNQVLDNLYPELEVRSKRIGGANYQVPMEVRLERKVHLAMIWTINAARSKSGNAFDQRLAREFVDAYKGVGDAVKKKKDVLAAAEANKAFAHFARF
ncbi:30S ribosomal protein S7 [Candidatus Saccharibacteria bacterium]|nr:30S ribosomal protein S7 [Candidatus Saccharibacteria bacterium]